MTNIRYKIRAKLWLYPGEAGWHFVTLPKKLSTQIKILATEKKKSWGSLPINATIGQTNWKTSLFPDSKAGAYMFPIKKEVRKKEKITAGDTVTIFIEVGV